MKPNFRQTPLGSNLPFVVEFADNSDSVPGWTEQRYRLVYRCITLTNTILNAVFIVSDTSQQTQKRF